ncbi:MAG TPA: hypothetical protein VE133_15330 [Candidatus Sulfotelmatobacter sp.]|nr:hypothetical protein [Candidatus Sulfotelmatobacter sp.]
MIKKNICLLIVLVALSAASFAGVTVSSPSTGTSTGSPVHFVASATSTNPITGMRIYLDSISVFSTGAAKIDAQITMATGKHTAIVKAWDSTGAIFSQTLLLTIGTSTPSATPTPIAPPAGAIVKSDIDQMPGWESCTVCAGAGANGPVAIYSLNQNVPSPSRDGKAAQFNISGPTPYSDALWWKQLGGNNAVKNFTYDLYFYLTNPQAAQALEFDVNQSDKVHKFIFGTQCNIKNGAHWDVWGNAAGNWLSTGISCTAPTAFTWHHLTWQFQRTATQVIYISFTYDGVTHYVNRSYSARGSSASEVNVAIQIDGDSKMTSYSEWVDKISLTYW